MRTARRHGSKAGEKIIRQLRQRLLDKLDTLPRTKWSEGLILTTPTGATKVVRTGLGIFFKVRGTCVMKVTLDPDRRGRFQGKVGNRSTVEEALRRLFSNP